MSAVQQMLMGAGGGATDPYYSSVSLLLHMDGSNGSTTFTDNSPSPKTVAANNGAQISTSVIKYGTGSVTLNGGGENLSVVSNAVFGYGTGDFTIEFWVYNVGGSGARTIISNLTSTSSTNPHLYYDGSLQIYYYTAGANRITSSATSANTWYHVALCRASGSTRLFINGSQSGSTYSDSNDYGATAPLGIGTYWNGGAPVSSSTLAGYIDDVRITKGVARYTANFTPPAAAFPNS